MPSVTTIFPSSPHLTIPYEKNSPKPNHFGKKNHTCNNACDASFLCSAIGSNRRQKAIDSPTVNGPSSVLKIGCAETGNSVRNGGLPALISKYLDWYGKIRQRENPTLSGWQAERPIRLSFGAICCFPPRQKALMKKINKNQVRYHTKASEKYVDVLFCYEDSRLYQTSIPIEYRRTGTEIAEEEIDTYIEKVYQEVRPTNWQGWKEEQQAFWNQKPKAVVTRQFFDELAKDFTWCCVSCRLPQNPNWARRIQDIKQFGYTLATHTNRPCETCQNNTTQIVLVPLKRGGITGYETWSPKLRNRIVGILGAFDVFEAKATQKEGLLPDHKFPEIRWDSETKRDSIEEMTDVEIRKDFQLLSNQRNQQKREVCRLCSQTGKRGVIYGIPFFSEGTETWDPTIPTKGKAAEKGCLGCGWYDIRAWRDELNRLLMRWPK